MKRLIVIMAVCAAAAAGQTAPDAKKTGTADFAFMSGCWEIDRPERKMRIREQWMRPEGNVLLGMAHTVRDGKTSGWEYMRIEIGDNGIFFISKPRENANETVFRRRTSEPGRMVFENPDHDFPQRVIYQNAGPNALNARIEGTQGGKESGIDFAYKRVKCN